MRGKLHAEQSGGLRPPLAGASVALWTPHGRSAVATIKVRGDLTALFIDAICSIPFRAANGKSLASQPIGRIVFGHWGAAVADAAIVGADAGSVRHETDAGSVRHGEEVVLCRSSDDELEIHCHGGVAAARRIIADWESLGFEVVDWTEQSRQAVGRLATECRSALSRATTLRTAGILLDQEQAWREFVDRVQSCSDTGAWSDLKVEVEQALSWRDLGRHLLEPFQVVLTGAPNVGKSALLNALVGYQRSVVFDQPGTTRDLVTAETAFDGWPVCLIDTAGLRENATGLEAAGIELAQGQLANADLVLQVHDATQPGDSEVGLFSMSPSKLIHVWNKIDLVTESSAIGRLIVHAATKVTFAIPIPASNRLIDDRERDNEGVAVSALTGTGMDRLITTIAALLVPQSPPRGTLIPFLDHQNMWLEELLVVIGQRAVTGLQQLVSEIE